MNCVLQNKTKDKNFSIFHAWNINFNAREQCVHTSAVKFMCVGSLKLSTRINESKALFPKHFIHSCTFTAISRSTET